MSFPKTVQTNAKATAATFAVATLVVVSTRIALRYVKQLLYYFLQKYLFFHLYSYHTHKKKRRIWKQNLEKGWYILFYWRWLVSLTIVAFVFFVSFILFHHTSPKKKKLQKKERKNAERILCSYWWIWTPILVCYNRCMLEINKTDLYWLRLYELNSGILMIIGTITATFYHSSLLFCSFFFFFFLQFFFTNETRKNSHPNCQILLLSAFSF